MVPLMPPASARDDVDDHAQLETAADLAQQLEIHRLGVVLGAVRGIAASTQSKNSVRARRERSAMAWRARRVPA